MWRSLDPNKDSRSRGWRRDERGVVLLLVLLVLALISVLVLTWAQEWRTELRLAANFREASQCHRLAEAGVYYALGKLLEAKSIETKLSNLNSEAAAAQLAATWRGDRSPHRLKLPGGVAEVRLEDEGGKINLNQATPETMAALFTGIGFPLAQIPTMADSILDWRTRGDQPRPNGAKSAYYLGLEPPYVSRNGPFEVVEELAWVRGFEGSPMIPRLGEWLTVQATQGINLNTAPLEVLTAVGIPPDTAQTIVVARERSPFTNSQDISMLALNAMPGQFQQLTFQASPFFTIKSTGMVNNRGGRQKIKCIVRLDLSMQNSWEILSWVDDFPG
jgi:general secretion pathway protein K